MEISECIKTHPEAWKRSLHKMAFRIPLWVLSWSPAKNIWPKKQRRNHWSLSSSHNHLLHARFASFCGHFLLLFFPKKDGHCLRLVAFFGKRPVFLYGITKSCEDCCTNTAHLISMHRRTRWPFQPAIGNDERCWIHWIHWASVANLQSTGTYVDVCISANIILYIAYIHLLFRNKKSLKPIFS